MSRPFYHRHHTLNLLFHRLWNCMSYLFALCLTVQLSIFLRLGCWLVPWSRWIRLGWMFRRNFLWSILCLLCYWLTEWGLHSSALHNLSWMIYSDSVSPVLQNPFGWNRALHDLCRTKCLTVPFYRDATSTTCSECFCSPNLVFESAHCMPFHPQLNRPLIQNYLSSPSLPSLRCHAILLNFCTYFFQCQFWELSITSDDKPLSISKSDFRF